MYVIYIIVFVIYFFVHNLPHFDYFHHYVSNINDFVNADIKIKKENRNLTQTEIHASLTQIDSLWNNSLLAMVSQQAAMNMSVASHIAETVGDTMDRLNTKYQSSPLPG